jgi:hypothetical protein
MIVAFLGPWTFDLIHVPSEFSCSEPNIRLDENFCGTPLAGILLYGWVIDGFIYSSTGLVTGKYTFSEWIRELIFSLLLFLPLLPIFSSFLLTLHKDRKRRQLFTIITWIMAICMGMFWGLNNYPKQFWIVWGIWLYIGLAITALILEFISLASKFEFGQ